MRDHTKPSEYTPMELKIPTIIFPFLIPPPPPPRKQAFPIDIHYKSPMGEHKPSGHGIYWEQNSILFSAHIAILEN